MYSATIIVLSFLIEYSYELHEAGWIPYHRTYTHHIGGLECYGSLNDKGEFLPYADSLFASLSSSPLASRNGLIFPLHMPMKLREVVYELRSGMLVPMQFDHGSKLIPIIDGNIIPFSEYRYWPGYARIYNLPGKFIIKPREMSRITDARSLFAVNPPIKLRKANAKGPDINQASTFAFSHDLNIPYRHVIRDWSFRGVLDNSGQFDPDIRTFLPKDEIPRDAPWLIRAKKINEEVYEFRNGVLIPMTINERNEVIPEMGGAIIDFKSYQYHKDARRIYNLPGKFVLKE